jgi:predicted dienelactone hydrolase
MNSLFGNGITTLKKSWLWVVGAILLQTLGFSNSTEAAERIYGSYSAFERSISVSALEEYANKGVVDRDLAAYTRYFQPAQLEQLQQALVTPIKISPVAISQFLYTSQGEFLLQRLEDVIKTQSREPRAGFHALRSALILAAAEPEGLTLLNVLRKYPSPGIRIDLTRAMGIAGELEKLVSETNRAVAAVSQKSDNEAASIQPPLNPSKLLNLRRRGGFTSQKHTLNLLDPARKRFLLTDIYLPNKQTQVPVIVISHGLGSDSSNFEYLASHLASYGFAVVVPNHPGSDTKQLQALLNGSTKEVAKPDEFKNRPLDIKYILDELEKRNRSDVQYRGRLNLQNVGVFGHSFGGYTALALAGAKINFERLKKDCNPEALQNTWNMSLLLQCNALSLQGNYDAKEYNFRDERVKAVIGVNPIVSSVFGKAGLSQIKVPVMIVASSNDTIAPALYEQILPFSLIPNSQKYLAVLSGATHFSVIGGGKNSSEQIALPSQLVGNDPSLARLYMNVLSLPFFETYVRKTPKSPVNLNAAYARAISTQSIGLSLIRFLTTTELAKALDRDIPQPQ